MSVKRYGYYDDERCQNCGKFADREECFYDRRDRENESSEILRFCNQNCADQWQLWGKHLSVSS